MITYATGNRIKFEYAQNLLKKYSLQISQKSLNIVEIQSNELTQIALHKAQSAYAILKEPLLVNDASWSITALNGFPGPYMSPVEDWFSTKDFLRLMNGIENREITLTEVVVYIDEQGSQVFSDSLKGVIKTEADAQTDFKSIDPIVTFRKDNVSLAKARSEDDDVSDRDLQIWEDFAVWYKNTIQR